MDRHEDLEIEVARFRRWACNVSPAGGEWEVDYPSWDALWAAAAEALQRPGLDEAGVHDLVYALARDNESGVLLRMMLSGGEAASRVAVAAAQSPDPDARWQATEVLARMGSERSMALLRDLLRDEVEYVRRSALLALVAVDTATAERVAIEWVTSAHDYSRLAALSALRDVGSVHLGWALESLRHDAFDVVRELVAEIEASPGQAR